MVMGWPLQGMCHLLARRQFPQWRATRRECQPSWDDGVRYLLGHRKMQGMLSQFVYFHRRLPLGRKGRLGGIMVQAGRSTSFAWRLLL